MKPQKLCDGKVNCVAESDLANDESAARCCKTFDERSRASCSKGNILPNNSMCSKTISRLAT